VKYIPFSQDRGGTDIALKTLKTALEERDEYGKVC
jgi:hypothetical protein